jgi:hypothetical protein
VAEELATLRPLEARLRAAFDAPDRAEAVGRALVLRDPGEARLFLRYHAEARTAFHRAFKELVRVLEVDNQSGVAAMSEADPVASDPGAAVSPNEPDGDADGMALAAGRGPDTGAIGPGTRVEAEAARTVSPNEPGRAAAASPNEPKLNGWTPRESPLLREQAPSARAGSGVEPAQGMPRTVSPNEPGRVGATSPTPVVSDGGGGTEL